MLKKQHITNQSRIFTALILTSILSVSSGLTLIKNATANPVNFSPATTNEVYADKSKPNRLPPSVTNAVLKDLASRVGISTSELQVIDYSQKTWRNGCLELPQANEFCTQALVPGWLVVVSNGKQKWTYHTNNNGRSLRLAGANNSSQNKLPKQVREGVLQQAQEVSGLSGRSLSILNFQATDWSDGCDRSTPLYPCDPIVVSGWQVTVGAANQRWVFLSDKDGSRIKLSQNESSTNTAKPIPTSELPPPLDQGVVFRQISSGGFAGRTYQTVLLNDGSLIRVRIGDANDSERSVRRVSRQQLQQFQQLLQRTRGEFRNLSYPAPIGAADYITYTLTSRDGTVQYNDIAQNNLSQNLQLVIKAWSEISNNQATDNTPKVVPIPKSELPPPLDQGVVFRQISSGGFAGRTYQTVLLNDGSLIRIRIGDANDSERSVRRISRQQVQELEQLLQRTKWDFRNVSYPAPNGAADFITYTLTSQTGTVQYNDISQNNLPTKLQRVVTAWNQLSANSQ
ncbi:hypothetical protein [Nostoc sp. LEGE 06077]|uniref:hypothetical protein n=1 Tax=Nostoc sp. LEGE 06077 TaxID=915325 RepID=UPI003A102A05